jgi:hypothetical protein
VLLLLLLSGIDIIRRNERGWRDVTLDVTKALDDVSEAARVVRMRGWAR